MSPVSVPCSIGLSRSALTTAIRLLALAAGLLGCSEPSAPASLKVAAVTATNGQTATIGTALPLPLSVRVQSDGVPKAGVAVTWQASAGTILPFQSVSDATGLASATWTLGMEPGAMTASTRVDGAQGSPVSFRATAVAPRVTVIPVPPSNGQSGVVGGALALPLRVQVRSDGEPKAGVTVRWHTFTGSLSPSEGTSDSDGFADANWTLGTVPGVLAADVTIVGAQSPATSFIARASPGPVVTLDAARGAGQTFPTNHAPDSLVAVAKDQYGNGVPGQSVTWSVEQGPVTLSATGGPTDEAGRSVSAIAATGPAGDAVVRAALPGVGLSTDFALTVGPPAFEVVLRTNGLPSNAPFAFVSSQNGSRSPAMDTIPAGRTVVWTLQFDYDQHGVASVGSPTFTGGDFPYANPSIVSVTFATPGTYHYADPYNPDVTGVVVVQ